MVGSETPRKCLLKDALDELQFLVCDASGQEVLLAQGERGHELPVWFSNDGYYRNMDNINSAAEDLFGTQFKFTMLQCIWNIEKDCTRDGEFFIVQRSVVVLECRDDVRSDLKDLRWVSISNADIKHGEKDAVNAIRQELKLLSHRSVKNRVPWANLGWYEKTTAWMRIALATFGVKLEENIVQIRVSPWGTVLRGISENGKFFLKASPCFCNEGVIASVLSDAAPNLVQKPLVLDKSSGMFIANDYGRTPQFLSSSDLIQLMKDVATLQKASTSKIDELSKAGVPVYTVGWVAENLDKLFEHEELSLMDDTKLHEGLEEVKEVLRAGLLKLEDLTDGLPMTIIHGDLREDNIYRRADGSGGFGFFDWDCACVALPIFEIRFWFDREEVVEAYLDEWTEFQSKHNLREALKLGTNCFYALQSFRTIYDLQNMEECCRSYCRSYLFERIRLLKRATKFIYRDFLQLR